MYPVIGVHTYTSAACRHLGPPCLSLATARWELEQQPPKRPMLGRGLQLKNNCTAPTPISIRSLLPPAATAQVGVVDMETILSVGNGLTVIAPGCACRLFAGALVEQQQQLHRNKHS